MDQVEARRILGVTENASTELCRKAYRRRIKRWHPDRVSQLSDQARTTLLQEWQAVFRSPSVTPEAASSGLNEAWKLIQVGSPLLYIGDDPDDDDDDDDDVDEVDLEVLKRETSEGPLTSQERAALEYFPVLVAGAVVGVIAAGLAFGLLGAGAALIIEAKAFDILILAVYQTAKEKLERAEANASFWARRAEQQNGQPRSAPQQKVGSEEPEKGRWDD